MTRYAVRVGALARENDPQAWVLQGSNDNGITWTPLDVRKDITFEWKCQRQWFEIAQPAAYQSYRLTITALHGATTSECRLAELQLVMIEKGR